MTYVPDWLPQPSDEDAIALARQIAFASVVSKSKNEPKAAHVPVYVDNTNRKLELRFHFAVNNPMVELLALASPTLLIFRGPDGYVSPSWYDHENVPTWDYAFVHMTGAPRPLTRFELKAHVLELVQRFDANLDMSDAYIEKYLDDVRGFSIVAPNVQSIIKLSQDKNEASIAGVVSGLRERGDYQLAESLNKHAIRRAPNSHTERRVNEADDGSPEGSP